jgi:hypothetical protein
MKINKVFLRIRKSFLRISKAFLRINEVFLRISKAFLRINEVFLRISKAFLRRKFARNFEKKFSKFEKRIIKAKKKATSVLKMEAHEAFRLALKFSRLQLSIRPRARVILKALPVLIATFVASSWGVAYLHAKEAEIKINGQAILVAEEKSVAETGLGEISQSVGSLRSPFLYEKPIEGHISQGYSSYHRALDITSPVGTTIKPVGPGVVEFAGYMPDGKGNVVLVDHGEGLKTLYAHMGKIHVGAGNMVNPNTSLGTVGLTGRTTGAHVHFEVYDKGFAVNPKNLLP